MFDDLKCSPKDEDEMEDFRDYGDESDDVDSKLDDYEETMMTRTTKRIRSRFQS